MATFPTYAKLLHAIDVQRESQVGSTPMETGPSKQARVRSRGMVFWRVKYALASLTDYNNFIDQFFDIDISGGADWFDYPRPTDDAIVQARIIDGSLDKETPNKHMDVWVVEFVIGWWG